MHKFCACLDKNNFHKSKTTLISASSYSAKRNKILIHAEVTPELKPKVSGRKLAMERHSNKEDIKVIDECPDKEHIFINQMHSLMQERSIEENNQSPMNISEDER